MTDAERLLIAALQTLTEIPVTPGEWVVESYPDGSTIMADWRDGELRLITGRLVSGMAVADGEGTV